jgi:hypothetical protein
MSLLVFFICVFLNAACGVIYSTDFCGVYLFYLLPLPLPLMVLLNFCVFCTALLGSFCAETACGASAALRAFVPAPKAQDAQIQLPVLV